MLNFLNNLRMGCFCSKEDLNVNGSKYTILSKIADGYVNLFRIYVLIGYLTDTLEVENSNGASENFYAGTYGITKLRQL